MAILVLLAMMFWAMVKTMGQNMGLWGEYHYCKDCPFCFGGK